MGKTEQRLFIAYLIWVIIEMIMQFWKDDFPVLHGVVKSGLMPILMALVAVTPKFTNVKVRMLLLGSLLFAWAGDVLLLFDDPYFSDRPFLWFQAGLGSFLVAQILYIFVFSVHSKQNNKRSVLLRHPFIAVTLVAVAVIMLRQLWTPALEEGMLTPILLYTVALMGMVAAALNRRGRTNDFSFALVLLGALSFLVSDALIALDHFVYEVHGLYIMATYMFAQGFIVCGLMFHNTRFDQIDTSARPSGR